MTNERDAIPSTAKALRDQILRLHPDLAQAQTRYVTMFVAAAILLTVIVTGGLLVFYPHPDAIYPLAVSLPLLLSFLVFRAVDAVYRRRARTMLIETLTITSGFTFMHDGFMRAADMAAHAVCPSGDVVQWGDGFTGSYNDAPLAFQDVTFGTKDAPLHCVAARIRLRRPVDAHTVVVTANAMKTLFRDRFANYGKVGVANPKYDRQIDIFATDRTEGRLMADAAFIELLMEAGSLLKSRWVAASFLKNEILMIFESPPPLLRLPPLWSPLTQDSLMHIYREFESFFRIIDAARSNKYI